MRAQKAPDPDWVWGRISQGGLPGGGGLSGGLKGKDEGK